jgi:hypothetical protein
MILDDNTVRRLLGSIEANRLVLLCGAGLSIPSPSDLMSAVRVSQACYDKYQPITTLPVAMRDEVDQVMRSADEGKSAGDVFVALSRDESGR